MPYRSRRSGCHHPFTRRHVFAIAAAGLAVTALPISATGATSDVVATDEEPHHHVIFQNGVIRLMRVLIPAGKATLWHEHTRDYAVTVIGGSTVRTESREDGSSKDGEMTTGSVIYGAYQDKDAIRRITNTGPDLLHQIAFELLRPSAGDFGKADRSEASMFALVLDEQRLKAWHLMLEPGASTPIYRQDGPGVRVVLSGQRIIETKPGEIGHEAVVQAGDAAFTLPATRVLTNAGPTRLSVIEFELR
ncbi:hypothetical protein LGH83_18920 [Lichenihabitans sp. PAMC28606]|uniref:hypothetical protein n=1 Tax=Lichenihabitans sp. PAMC28606 TaxID=2880932 RepID=UPI001D0B3DF1|nr:hypothetical protein [Lichenihabitans sp. PAMC28606]UDL94544.1 hypothetical protein LGH83_18920 [Lichenihabitans sp. PAMC28606]